MNTVSESCLLMQEAWLNNYLHVGEEYGVGGQLPYHKEKSQSEYLSHNTKKMKKKSKCSHHAN